jgi:hypothetical protein
VSSHDIVNHKAKKCPRRNSLLPELFRQAEGLCKKFAVAQPVCLEFRESANFKQLFLVLEMDGDVG